MTVDNREQLIELANKVFAIIEAIKAIRIDIDEMQIILKGIHINGKDLGDINA